MSVEELDYRVARSVVDGTWVVVDDDGVVEACESHGDAVELAASLNSSDRG